MSVKSRSTCSVCELHHLFYLGEHDNIKYYFHNWYQAIGKDVESMYCLFFGDLVRANMMTEGHAMIILNEKHAYITELNYKVPKFRLTNKDQTLKSMSIAFSLFSQQKVWTIFRLTSCNTKLHTQMTSVEVTRDVTEKNIYIQKMKDISTYVNCVSRWIVNNIDHNKN